MAAKKIDTVLDKGNNVTKKILFIIFVFTMLLYSNSIKNNYALDDNYVTVTNPQQPNNPRIEKGIKGIPHLFKSHYVESASQSFEYRPLVLATFAVEYQFFGSNPHVSHFISVLLYALTCMLLFTLLSKLFKNYNLVFPLLITFLFMVHPIHTEVVDNIKCRDELLSFLFGLCALYFFIKSVEIESKKWQFILYTILFLLLGLLCKKTTVLFVIFIPLTGYFFYDFKLKKIFFYGLLFYITLVAYNLFRRSMINELITVREFVFFENPLYFDHSFLTRISLSLYSMGYYLKLLVFPFPLCCYYGYNTIPVNDWSSPLIYIALIFYAAIGIYALVQLPKKNILSYAIIIFLLGILPFANLLKPVVGIVGERFIYFASLGFCIIASYGILLLFKMDVKDKSKFKIQNSKFIWFSIVIFVAYSGLTLSRNTKWKDILTLFRNDAQQFESSYLLQNFTAISLFEQSANLPSGYKKEAMVQEAQFRIKNAATILSEGLIKYKEDYLTTTTLGTIYNNYLNDVERASMCFKKSFAINPKYDVTRFNIGLCYQKKALLDSAFFVYENMVLENTTYPPVYFNLHELCIVKKEYKKAILFDKKAVVNCPKEFKAKAYINLGNIYMMDKDTLHAISSFKEAISIEPKNIGLRNQVNAFLIMIKRQTSFLY